MKNIMDMYLNFTEKRIKKYMKFIYGSNYDENIVSEYLKTYINARYYNIQNTDKPARAFYLRILDELDFKANILTKRIEEYAESLEEKQEKIKFINNVKEIFAYVLFFDNVRNVENFKTIDNIKEVVEKMIFAASTEYKIKNFDQILKSLNKEISSDMLEKEMFLEKFETDEFMIELEACEQKENVYFAKIEHDVKMPTHYSSSAIEKVFTEGLVAEDKLQIEYILLSLISVRDIISGNFNDIYIAEFTNTLFKKKTKLDGILELINNEALQEKISINIDYSDYIENSKTILEYTNKGYNFVITLDNHVKCIQDVEKLKMFKIVIAPEKLVLYKELKQNKTLFNNIIFK